MRMSWFHRAVEATDDCRRSGNPNLEKAVPGPGVAPPAGGGGGPSLEDTAHTDRGGPSAGERTNPPDCGDDPGTD